MLDKYMKTLFLGTEQQALQNWDPREKGNMWGEPHIHHGSLPEDSFLT